MHCRTFPSVLFRSASARRLYLAGALALAGGCAGRQAAPPADSSATRPASRPSAAQPDPAAIPLSELTPIPRLPTTRQATTRASRPPVEALLLYAKARDAMREGRRFSAITLLQRAISLDPDGFELYMALAQARQGPGAGDEQVIEALNKAVALRPESLRAQASLGRQYLGQGNLDQAIRHLRLARLSPDYRGNGDEATAVDLFLARALQQKGYIQAALDVYDTLLGRLEHPDIAMRGNRQLMMLISQPEGLYLDVARLHEQRGQEQEALNAYEAAARHEPEDFEINAQSVRVLLKLGRTDEATARALQLVRRFGGSAQSLELLNQTYTAAGKSDQVAADLQKLSRAHPDDRGLMLALAGALGDHGQKAQAEKMLQEALKANPKDLTILQRLFELYNVSGDVASAARVLIEYSAAQPRRQEELGPMWQQLLRPDRSPRLTLAVMEKIQVDPPARAARLFWMARIADMGQRSAQARQLLEEAIQISPPYAPAYEAMQGVYWGRDGWTAAQKAQASSKLADLAARKGDAALAAELHGLDALRQGQWDRASKALAQAIQLGADGSDVKLAQATVLHRQGKNAEYERALWAIVGEDAKADDAWGALFQYYIQTNQAPRAVSTLGKWLSENPDSPSARLIQAGVYLRSGRTPQAQRILMDLVKEGAQRPSALAMLREIFVGSGHPQQYTALLEQLRSEHPADLTILEQLVDAYGDAKQPQKALAGLDAARARVHDPETLYLLAHLYQLAGQKPTSEAVLQQALKADPDYAPANNDLGYTWAEQGKNLAQAEAMIRAALKIDPENSSFLDSLGWVLYKQGRFESARQQLQKAAQGQSPDPVILNHLGDTLYRLLDKAQAAHCWQQSLERIGKLPAPRDELIQLRGELQRKLAQTRQNQPVTVAPSRADKAART